MRTGLSLIGAVLLIIFGSIFMSALPIIKEFIDYRTLRRIE